MERQAHMTMAHLGVQEEHRRESVDPSEEQFLKSLYLFMKKRDTPIERIPHLGFKQIDLFVMFKTVRGLGGYQQVTAQQLWKQVYNSLGGNPRSTSAATCTRRHYEKLLLPYECHLKGQLISIMPPHAIERFRYHGYSPEDNVGDGPRPAKRKLMSMPLHHQNHANLQPGPVRSLFALPYRTPHYCHPSHSVLPPYVPMSASILASHSQPIAPPPKFPFPPCGPNPTERLKEPLEHLRYLAEQYKSSTGLDEPLNLSIKAQSHRTDKNPKSSFSLPSLSKTPKFLNTPSSLYTPQYPPGSRKEGGRKPDDGMVPYLAKARDNSVVDLTSMSSPEVDASSTDCRNQTEEQVESPEGRRFHLSHILHTPPSQNNSKMEIEIPLSVFHNWLQLYGPPGAPNDMKQLARPQQVEQGGRRSKDVPTNLSFHLNSHQHSSAIQDLRLVNRKVPSPRSSGQAAASHYIPKRGHFSGYSPSSRLCKPAATVDGFLGSQQGVSASHSTKPPTYWEALAKDRPPSPVAAPQDLTVTTSCHGEAESMSPKAETSLPSSSLLMMNSGSASMLQLTNEEVMKLKKIISNSS
ncbi:AT-rich interaction domain 6 [Dunckerocampus dactyliophorus]|uniref:AT-rich interaction domain 6 n=1 Tax=Dunckerocampus dactyliophorus TaxID=161453 RepID=UPI002404DF19|nr:AT-rich interaction domain 6 [Dunckerocampus dactyliophorus]